ncbi:hypothetical protein [Mycolicibacterium fortuitum]|uniref:hypothetical protein n=1 Tax=Mycolicibacterium fortuitum TaxID=1766 RepID=UPI001CDB7183|nr:hypothetical protein [Mycolicibacterium fortuitum]UBV13916.1 hypothetical protein H8Z57_24430 [Mycolicibacterium fortuitum]
MVRLGALLTFSRPSLTRCSSRKGSWPSPPLRPVARSQPDGLGPFSTHRAQPVIKVRNGYSTITDFGRQLLEEHPANITEETLEAIPDYQNYQPKVRHTPATEAEDGPPFWFVSDRRIIVETKFADALMPNQFGAPKFSRNQMLQLYAYVRSQHDRDDLPATAEGVLLYPAVRGDLDEYVVIHEHRYRFLTVDLAADMRAIRERMQAVVTAPV